MLVAPVVSQLSSVLEPELMVAGVAVKEIIEGGVAAAYRREIERAEDPKAREKELEAQLRAQASPFRTAEAFAIEDIIDPRETRAYLCRFIDAAQGRIATSLGPKPKYGVRP